MLTIVSVLVLESVALAALLEDRIRAKVCMELTKFRVLDDEEDIEEYLRVAVLPRNEVFTRVLTDLLLHCYSNLSQNLLSRVQGSLPVLYLTPEDEAFLHLPLDLLTEKKQVEVGREEQDRYQEIIDLAKEYEAGDSRYLLPVTIGGLTMCGLGFVYLRYKENINNAIRSVWLRVKDKKR